MSPTITKILFVDDDPTIRAIGQIGLSQIPGSRVIVASSGQEALELAFKEVPDAIILDVHLPDISGPEVLQRLRADSATSAVPVVFVTADSEPSEVERLKKLGATGVLEKPFDPLRLPALLQIALPPQTPINSRIGPDY